MSRVVCAPTLKSEFSLGHCSLQAQPAYHTAHSMAQFSVLGHYNRLRKANSFAREKPRKEGERGQKTAGKSRRRRARGDELVDVRPRRRRAGPRMPAGLLPRHGRRPLLRSLEAPPGRGAGAVGARHRAYRGGERLPPGQSSASCLWTVEYEYAAEGRPRFGLSLGLLVDCLNTFSAPGHASAVEIRYPCTDMQLLLKSAGQWAPQMHSAILKESIDDLEWSGSSIQIQLQPDPPSVIFKGEGHGDLQVSSCNYLKFPSNVMKENRGSKVTIGRGGMLKLQHLVSVVRPGMQYFRNVAGDSTAKPDWLYRILCKARRIGEHYKSRLALVV